MLRGICHVTRARNGGRVAAAEGSAEGRCWFAGRAGSNLPLLVGGRSNENLGT